VRRNQKSAIRRLIAAKSDREIARLPRQTYQLLNLHQRPRSNISHQERWLDYELKLLGRIRDEELARLLRRSQAAVAGKRESLGIPIFAPRRTAWSKREIELLGKRPDPVVARMLGRTKYAVQLKRYSLGIPQCWEDRRAWMAEENKLLGKMRDQEVAKKLGRSLSSVRSHRNEQTNIRFIKTPKRWTKAELRLLGRLPAALGVSWHLSGTSGSNWAFLAQSERHWPQTRKHHVVEGDETSSANAGEVKKPPRPIG
jgi:hypothetical protein